MTETQTKASTSESGILQHLSGILGDLGYRAQISGDLLVTSAAGVRTTLRWYEAGSIQLASGFREVPTAFSIEQANQFNSQYRFGSVYKEEENLFLQANFLLLNPESEDVVEHMELIISLYEGLVSELRNALAAAEGASEDDTSEIVEE